MTRTARAACLILGAALMLPTAAAADATVSVAVADFDSDDTSGEAAERAAAHSTRVAGFGALLRDSLAAQGIVAVRPLHCPAACSAASLTPDDLAAAARKAGARLLVVGGIHKMSTLIQWGAVQLVDLEKNQVLMSRTFSFRGDTDAAFRRAAEFLGETLKEALPKS